MPIDAIGWTAAELLFDLIEGRPLPERHVVLPTELVLRGSTPAAGSELIGSTTMGLRLPRNDRPGGGT
jgi:hypothetical protein